MRGKFADFILYYKFSEKTFSGSNRILDILSNGSIRKTGVSVVSSNEIKKP